MRVTELFGALQKAHIEGIKNLHPAYRSLLVVYDAKMWTAQRLIEKLEGAEESPSPFLPVAGLLRLPVCFAPGFAPDLPQVCATAGIEPEQAIQLLTAATYRVAFLGFAPGFPYLMGLSPELATPRHARPRTHIPAGSVGIAGAQTGIYPAATPGGWQIVGRTPVRLFSPEREPMSLLNTGDERHLFSIDETEFEAMSQW